MKKLLSILSICLVFISCSPDRVLKDDLTRKGEVVFFESKPFTGVAFDIWRNGQLAYEGNYINGKQDGLAQYWFRNGLLQKEGNYKDGEMNGLAQYWYDNGQLQSEVNFKNGEKESQINYNKDGIRQ